MRVFKDSILAVGVLRFASFLSVVAALGAVACGSDSDKGTPGPGSGGTPGSGGAAATGGGPTETGGTTATGGTSATGGSSASSGGTAPTGGAANTGGAATGGTAATGGSTTVTDGGSDSDAGYPPNPGTVDVVVCKEDGTACSQSENCCYTRATTFPPPGTPAAFTCNAKPCTGGDLAVSCDGLEDCHGGQQCCRVDLAGGMTSYSCRDSCPSTVIECAGPANCPSGTVCCQHQFLNVATETKCETTCSGGNAYIMCNKKEDCPANAPNCVASTTVPAFRACQ
jgi:hypothetical protein